jgi:hypothetical protein
MLAKNALNPIEEKLTGVYSANKEKQKKEISTSNLVQMLIQEATDPTNLVRWQHNVSYVSHILSGEDVSWMGSLVLAHTALYTITTQRMLQIQSKLPYTMNLRSPPACVVSPTPSLSQSTEFAIALALQ